MYTVFETFVGAGGSHLGFINNGFKSKYVNDFDDNCLKTLVYNNPELEKEAVVDNSSIVDIDPNEILKQTEMKPKELDVLFGGLVCKGFSLAGERSPNDERNYFYRKQLNIVKVVQPKISIIENVPGIQNAKVLSPDAPDEIAKKIDETWQKLENYKGLKASVRKSSSITKEIQEQGKILRKEKEDMIKYLEDNKLLISVIDDIKMTYDKLGYNIYMQVLNSACYGAATKRERVIIVAVRKDINIDFEFPKATYGNKTFESKYPYLYIGLNNEIKPLRTVNDALSTINYENKEDIDNIPMQHSPKTIKRFKYIPEGDSIANHIDELPEDLKISKFYSRGNTMRLAGDEPSPTLVPGHSNFPVHPKEDRSITVREAATITGFPQNYKFFGSHTKRCEEVGNAVPPPLSTAIAKSAKELLDKYYNKL
jgi:DNA (cytosine-5)-methyltransferase 1